MKTCFYLSMIFLAAMPGFLFAGDLTGSLSDAITKGDVQAVRDLLDKQPELANTVFTLNPKGAEKPAAVSALCMALQKEKKEIAELLLSKGADPRQNWEGYTPLFYASMAGYWEMIPLLVQKGDTPNPDKEKTLNCPLAWAKDMKTAQALIACGADVNYRNKDGDTPLHSICHFSKPDIAELLLQKGADVNAKDQQGQTPLHEAARECRFEMASYLVDHGANVNAPNNAKMTPLEYCMGGRIYSDSAPHQLDYYKILNLLISKGSHAAADQLARAGDVKGLQTFLAAMPLQTNSKDHAGNPLLICAIQEGQANVVKFLLQQGADPNVPGKSTPPPLHAAVYAGNPDVVQMLLKAGADIHSKGQQGETALHWIAIQTPHGTQYEQIARLLIESGADLNVQAKQPRPNMKLGIDQPIDQIKELLRWDHIEKNKNSDVQVAAPIWLAYNTGDTPLHSAARWGRFGIVDMLVKAGAKIDIPNDYGQTPLHYAVAANHTDVLKTLLEAGANPNAVMKDGTSAIQLAEKIDSKEALELLAHYRSFQK